MTTRNGCMECGVRMFPKAWQELSGLRDELEA
jgi:hypothetical protein